MVSLVIFVVLVCLAVWIAQHAFPGIPVWIYQVLYALAALYVVIWLLNAAGFAGGFPHFR